MKRRIISIFLIVSLLFSLTACKGNTNSELQVTHTETEAIQSTIPMEEEQSFTTLPLAETKPIDHWEVGDGIGKIDSIEIKAMSIEELNAFAENLVLLSESEELSDYLLTEIGWLFNTIWVYAPEYDKVKFEKEFCEAFDNVYEYVIKNNIPVDYLDTWSRTPIPQVITKYLSSSNFPYPVYVNCDAIPELSDDGLLAVTTAFVNNPELETNAEISRSIICTATDETVRNMAWEHLLKLSNSDVASKLDNNATNHVLKDIFGDNHYVYTAFALKERVYNSDHITQIAENILRNPSFGLKEKYLFFCSDFFHGCDVATEISRMAMHMLYDELTNASKEDCILIAKVLADIYYIDVDKPLSDVNYELRETFVCLMNYCYERLTY